MTVTTYNFRTIVKSIVSLVLMACMATISGAQQTNSVVPTLVNFSGTLTDANGKPLTGTVGVTFYLYKDQQGGSPLWVETQNVQLDKSGHYTVALGASNSQGLPTNLFATGEARWLGVQSQGQAEQARIMLLAVPYALKAGDAQTIGGLPPSAFVLAPPSNSDSSAASSSNTNSNPNPPALGGSGKTDYLPIWTNSSTLGDSVLFQSGTGAKAKVGIGTTKPASTLDVKGGGTIHGLFSLPATGTATASGGFNSQPMDLVTSAFNSGTSTAVPQTFQWRAEPVGNNTNNASGSLNLLFGQGSGKPAETGLNIASNGQITFAKGQTFPGTGNGTITGVTAGTDLTGGGSSGNVTLNVDTAKVVTGVTAGTDLTGGGTGGSLTLNLDTTKVPQLAAANTFTNSNSISVNSNNPNLSLTNTGSGDGIDMNLNGGTGISINGVTYGVAASASSDAGIFRSNSLDGIYAVGPAAGIYAENDTDAQYLAASYGFEEGSTQQTIGVYGYSASNIGFGVYGQDYSASNTGAYLSIYNPAGVWGDSGRAVNAGILGTADDGFGAIFANSSPTGYATLGVMDLDTTNSSALLFEAVSDGFGGECKIDVNGNLSCNGSVTTPVKVQGGSRNVALSAIEAPENWFEDAGSGHLSNGGAVVNLEDVFGETVNTEIDYHVFLTPKGDCEGLYVSNETARGFEVHELRHGSSNIAFDYRIMAKRRGFENVRLEDKTKTFRLSESPYGQGPALHRPQTKMPSANELREKHKAAAARQLARLASQPIRKAN